MRTERDGAGRCDRAVRAGARIRLRQRRSRRRHRRRAAACSSPMNSPTLAKAEVARLGWPRAGRACTWSACRWAAASRGWRRRILPKVFAGTLIIAGAGGDLVTRLDRLTKMAALWPLIDPRAHAGMSVDRSEDRRLCATRSARRSRRAGCGRTPAPARSAAAARPQTATEETTGEAAGADHRSRRHVGRPGDPGDARLSRARRSRTIAIACIRSKASGTCRAMTMACRGFSTPPNRG